MALCFYVVMFVLRNSNCLDIHISMLHQPYTSHGSPPPPSPLFVMISPFCLLVVLLPLVWHLLANALGQFVEWKEHQCLANIYNELQLLESKVSK